MKIQLRYIAYQFVMPFFMATVFFVTFLLTFELLKLMKLVVNKGVGLSIIFDLIGHMGVSFIPLAIPLSVLFATIYTFNKLSTDSEYMAMRSYGLSRFKIFRPVLLTSIIIGVVTYSLNYSVVPYSKKQFKNSVVALTSSGLIADIKRGQFYTEIPEITLFAEDVTDEGKELTDVYIHIQEKKGIEKIVMAKSGELIKYTVDPLLPSNLRLKLFDGNILKSDKVKKNYEKILFAEYDFPVMDGQVNPSFVTKDSMRTTTELTKILDYPRKKRRKLKISDKDFIKTKLEYWSRINTPVLCIVFCLLGFGVGVQKTRGRNQNSGVLCLIILVAYYTIFFAGISIARGGNIPAFVATFTPGVITTFVALYLYKKLERVA